jgi:hypothetical protein
LKKSTGDREQTISSIGDTEQKISSTGDRAENFFRIQISMRL